MLLNRRRKNVTMKAHLFRNLIVNGTITSAIAGVAYFAPAQEDVTHHTRYEHAADTSTDTNRHKPYDTMLTRLRKAR